MSARRVGWALLLACVSALPASLPHAAATGASAQYVSGGTAVVRANGQPVADEGTVVCDDGHGIGTGGFCLPFVGGSDAIRVLDDTSGEAVAFQVCVDNSGDGACTSPDFGPCADVVVFSHDDAGNFFNPVGPVPTGFASGCAGGPWKGYVVLLCEGVHVAGTNEHSHAATTGTGTVTTGGEGLGTFCGGTPIQQSRKPYKIGSGAAYVGGGTAVSRNDGQPTADEGVMQCNGGDNRGVGGFCTSFGSGDAMAVFDDVSGTDVAFQVCIDNSGDGACTSPDNNWSCPDEVFFSHDDNGAFYNPLGPIPTGFLPGCGAGAWDGYVVFLCEGTHTAGVSAHSHAATTGNGRVTTGGEGTGDFCGGSGAQPSTKRYEFAEPPGTRVFNGDGTCTLRGASSEPVTGGQDTVTGEASGQVTSTTPGEQVTIRCVVEVNGVEVAVTPAAAGNGVASTRGQVTFTAGENDTVTLCADGSRGSEAFHECTELTTTQIPPQEVRDLLAQIVQTVKDATGT